MKILTIILILVLISSNVYAVDIIVPMRCWKDKLIEEYAKEGLNMKGENDPLADGWIENQGDHYTVHTYEYPKDWNKHIRVQTGVDGMLAKKLKGPK